jgi:RHS repeat-associated protein
MFTGRNYDSEIAEYYLRARQYDPHIARFTSRDPIFGQFQEPLTLHKYLYCINDPVNKIDPSGEWAATRGIAFNIAGGLGGMTLTLQYFYGLSDDLTFFSGYALTVAGGWEPQSRVTPIGNKVGLEASASLVYGYSPNAESPEDLGGIFLEGGGSYGAGYSVGVNWAISPETGVRVQTVALGFGVGAEMHGQVSQTYIFSDVTIGPSMHYREPSRIEQYLARLVNSWSCLWLP